MKTTVINGETFEVTTTTKRFNNNTWMDKRDLMDYYEKPSTYKVGIWNEWKEWAANSYPMVYDMRVTSANTFSFTIGAYYCDPETYEIIGYIQITKAHNRLYLYK